MLLYLLLTFSILDNIISTDSFTYISSITILKYIIIDVFNKTYYYTRIGYLRKDDKSNPRLAKYKRDYFFKIVDSLINKVEFKDKI